MAFASDAQRRWFFTEMGGFGGAKVDRLTAYNAINREAAVRAHYDGQGFSAAAVDRAVERARENGFGDFQPEDTSGWTAKQWAEFK
jgi:GNAT superfamily N-acetyltransferase